MGEGQEAVKNRLKQEKKKEMEAQAPPPSLPSVVFFFRFSFTCRQRGASP
jgi:hypothetical protein